MDCALCGALQREPNRIIHRDDHVFVLVNVEPVKEGHVMILPVRHAENLKDLDPEESRAFLSAIDYCMSAITKAYGETPMCLVNGWEYRTQRHLHAHVLPSKKSLRGLYAAAEGLQERARADEDLLMKIAGSLKRFFEIK